MEGKESTPMHMIERGIDGASLRLVQGPLVGAVVRQFSASRTVFSGDGRLLACILEDGVDIYDISKHSLVRTIPTPGTVAVHFSAAASYMVVYQKANFSGAGDGKNLTVWKISSGRVIFSCFQKIFNKNDWPTFQFTSDETVACRVVTNEVHFFRLSDLNPQPKRLRIPNVFSIKVSPGHLSKVIAFVPELKGLPGNVQLYDHPSFQVEGIFETEPLARKSFFRVQEVEFKWADDGAAVLIHGSSEIDATNQSYYGESSLHFMRANGSLDCKVQFSLIGLFVSKFLSLCLQVPLDKEGPVHEAAWSTRNDEFVVVYGFMPAKATIFSSDKCEPRYQLGTGPYNTVRWNPFGRFVCLAGFGNLPGDVVFFDRKADGKYKVIGSTRASCSVSSTRLHI